MVGIAVERLALGNISRNLDFLQALAVAQPLLLHLPIQDRQFMFAVLAVAKQLEEFREGAAEKAQQ